MSSTLRTPRTSAPTRTLVRAAPRRTTHCNKMYPHIEPTTERDASAHIFTRHKNAVD